MRKFAALQTMKKIPITQSTTRMKASDPWNLPPLPINQNLLFLLSFQFICFGRLKDRTILTTSSFISWESCVLWFSLFYFHSKTEQERKRYLNPDKFIKTTISISNLFFHRLLFFPIQKGSLVFHFHLLGEGE